MTGSGHFELSYVDFIFKLKKRGGDDTETQAFSLKSIMFSVEVNSIFIAKKSIFT